MAGADPRPPAARTDLQRLARRWHELPSDRALAVAPEVLAVAQEFADAAADVLGLPRVPLPEVGPAAVPDVLAVTAHDLLAADPGRAQAVTARLAAVRRRVGAA